MLTWQEQDWAGRGDLLGATRRSQPPSSHLELGANTFFYYYYYFYFSCFPPGRLWDTKAIGLMDILVSKSS